MLGLSGGDRIWTIS